MSLISYILVGCPSSGKSTIASQLVSQNSNLHIVSTDKIREQLFGDEIIQGNWQLIETEILLQIQQHLTGGHSVIYDATNAKRSWRMDLLQKLQQYENVQWIGLHLKTPLEVCKQWNQQRQRQVPEDVIENMYNSLKDFPPINAEGFSAVYSIPYNQGKMDITPIIIKSQELSRNLINRANRTNYKKAVFHQYSKLIDFDRLMHLISLIIQYPGIGNLQNTNPEQLINILGREEKYETEIDEISAIITHKISTIYANQEAITNDLAWLENNGILGDCHNFSRLNIDTVEYADLVTHAYSEIEPFERLIKIIRFIIHHPFIYESEQGTLDSLISRLQDDKVIDFNCTNSLRKDIEKILKPFQIFSNFSMKRGYFIGTAILTKNELIQVFHLLEAQAKSLADPIALSIYETFRDNLSQSQITLSEVYPVRAIYNRTIVDLDTLPQSSLAHKISELETAIEEGQLLELNRIQGGGRFSLEPDNFFLAYPLQIVFHNIGWYLAFEIAEDKNKGLFKFERLDRLFLGQKQSQQRNRKTQDESLKKLKHLYQSSGGIYLGNNSQDQQRYLSTNNTEKAKVEIMIELWFNDPIFRFISEGDRRYPKNQMKMSPRLKDISESKKVNNKPPFTLKQTNDPDFPNRFQVSVPKWCLDDFDLLRWIVGFGNQVKVISPPELVLKVKEHGNQITRLYQTEN